MLRRKLFISYSRADTGWLSRFMVHLNSSLRSKDDLWVDADSIEGGADWLCAIENGIQSSRCALLLLTPNYLNRNKFSRQEFDMLSRARRDGLRLLPVLVEPCLWHNVPELTALNLVSWPTQVSPACSSQNVRQVPWSIKEAAECQMHGHFDENMASQIIMAVCDKVIEQMGIANLTTESECLAICAKAKENMPAIKNWRDDHVKGDKFSIIMRGSLGNRDVAVKVIPEAAKTNHTAAFLKDAVARAVELQSNVFVDVIFSETASDPICIVMEFLDQERWTTLSKSPERQFSPVRVATLLADIARAQRIAHKMSFPLGPLILDHIYLDRDGHIKIVPFSVEAQLARCVNIQQGQVLNWDMLSFMSPETYSGRAPVKEQLDSWEQYYLGLLGLELLTGRRAIVIQSFRDIPERLEPFFRCPRNHFGSGEGDTASWTENCPALAYVLSKLLSEDVERRYSRTEVAEDELRRIALGKLPMSLRDEVENGYEAISKTRFVGEFYKRLFKSAPDMRSRFSRMSQQHQKFVHALLQFLDYDPDRRYGAFHKLARQHAELHPPLTVDEIDNFRRAFVLQIKESFGSQIKADAWNAVLKHNFEPLRHQAAQSRSDA